MISLDQSKLGCVGYVLKVFPRFSETFVANELRALEASRRRLSIFSLHRGEAAPHQMLREIRSSVFRVDEQEPDERDVGAARRVLSERLRIAADRTSEYLPRRYVRLAVRLANLARAQGVEHLHAHFASRAAHVAALAATLVGCTYSITAHAKDIYHRDVDRELLRWKVAQARFVVTVTDYNQRHIQDLVAELPGAAAKIVRIYNGVDLRRFHPDERPRPARPLVLGIGRLVEKKGFSVLVQACRLLRDRGLEFRCEIVGGGPDEAMLRTQIASADLGSVVHLRGVSSNEQVAELLRSATVMALPCLVGHDGNMDALPTVILEAMATACPIVSTRLSGIPEMVRDGQTGLLVQPGDAVQLAGALEQLLRFPDRAREMGAAGRRRSQQLFDLQVNAARLDRLFDQALQPRAPA